MPDARTSEHRMDRLGRRTGSTPPGSSEVPASASQPPVLPKAHGTSYPECTHNAMFQWRLKRLHRPRLKASPDPAHGSGCVSSRRPRRASLAVMRFLARDRLGAESDGDEEAHLADR